MHINIPAIFSCRVTIQSLFYLKWQLTDLMNKCRRSKFQIIFRPRFIEHLPKAVLRCLFKQPEEEGVNYDALHNAIGENICSDSSVLAERPKGSFADAVERYLAANTSKNENKKKWKKYVLRACCCCCCCCCFCRCCCCCCCCCCFCCCCCC